MQSWRSFLDNHVEDLVSIDFFIEPTVTFKVLFVFVVLTHERRRVVHFNVTDSPTAKWTCGYQKVRPSSKFIHLGQAKYTPVPTPTN